jgi:hypothetical protein
MIIGIHAILYSKHAAAVRGFLADVLDLHSVDAGDGWPIFAATPIELAVHPTDDEPEHEPYLMCAPRRRNHIAIRRWRSPFDPSTSSR